MPAPINTDGDEKASIWELRKLAEEFGPRRIPGTYVVKDSELKVGHSNISGDSKRHLASMLTIPYLAKLE